MSATRPGDEPRSVLPEKFGYCFIKQYPVKGAADWVRGMTVEATGAASILAAIRMTRIAAAYLGTEGLAEGDGGVELGEGSAG